MVLMIYPTGPAGVANFGSSWIQSHVCAVWHMLVVGFRALVVWFPACTPLTKSPNSSSRPRVTMTDIGYAAGVSVSTVSLALRNSPLIPLPTRKRVQGAAARLGYVLDPQLSRLMSYLHRPSATKPAGTVAYLTGFDPPDAWRSVPVWCRYFSGAQRRAEELGYKVEEFSMCTPGMTPKRLSRVLRARGITGIVVAPLPEGTHQLAFEWDQFSAVAIGLSLWEPRHHCFVHHHLASMTRALESARARGYRRLALVLQPNHDLRVQRHWSAAYLAEQRHAGLAATDLIFDRLDQPAEFIEWFRQCRPDVVIGDNLVAARILDQAGYRIPRDCGYIVLNLAGFEKGFAGIDQRSESIGASAVSRLVARLHQNESGVPEIPETTLVPGTWMDGASLPTPGDSLHVVRPQHHDVQKHPHLSRLR